MRALAEVFASYVPFRVAQRLVAGGTCEPFAERLRAGVLFADISGSTALAERLAAHGPTGMEEFSRLLNAYLGALIDVVIEHAGDVVKFAGDGLFALWPAATAGDLALMTRRAARCALAVQRTLRECGAAMRTTCQSSRRRWRRHNGGVTSSRRRGRPAVWLAHAWRSAAAQRH
jgi:class 3 adenylate cyclase